MSCPTCDHTMEGIGGQVFWCPRCGTIKCNPEAPHASFDVERPKLVDRCRRFEETLGPSWLAMWRRLGVAESINLPGHRRDVDAAPPPL